MTEFHSLHGQCPPIPDNLTCPQFTLDVHHPNRTLRVGNIPWLIEDATGRTIGYEELRMRTHGLANALYTRYGMGNNDVVCIFSSNHVDYPIAIWASHRLGAIVTCANPSYTAGELEYQLRASSASLLITLSSSFNAANEAARQCGIPANRILLLDDNVDNISSSYFSVRQLVNEGLSTPVTFKEPILSPGEGKSKIAFLSFSSGTTGKPKSVKISHYSVIANVLQMSAHHKTNDAHTPWEERRFRPGDVAAAVLPFYHIYGLIVVLHWILFSGLTIVVIPKFSFLDYLKSIVKYKITHIFVVPPQVVLFCKHPAVKDYDLSHVRFCISGAAPLSAELTQQLIQVLPNASIGQGYGMTETCASISMIPITQRIGTAGSAGQLVPGCIARVVKEDGSIATYDEMGELYVKGPNVALGYLNDEQSTKDTFIDGWVRTGDEVKISRNGDLFVVDRLKEILKVRGFQVAPAELEGHLLDHPEVADACVVGIPDEFSGEVPLAFIVLEANAALRAKSHHVETAKLKASISKHVSDAKAPYKWLAGGIEFVEAIPKNPSGKLLRRFMRDRARAIRGKINTAKL